MLLLNTNLRTVRFYGIFTVVAGKCKRKPRLVRNSICETPVETGKVQEQQQ